MTRADLVRMANQIAANFAHLGGEEAAAETAGHLRRFWAPSMRAELLDAPAGDELSAVARAAVEMLRVDQMA